MSISQKSVFVLQLGHLKIIIFKVKILRDDTQMTRPAVNLANLGEALFNFTETRNELKCVLALIMDKIESLAIHKFQMISNKLI